VKFFVIVVALVFGAAGADAGERSYYATTHKLVSQMNFGAHPEYRTLMEGLLNEVTPSAQGYVSHMIRHAPRGPGGGYIYNPATGSYELD
jgi:hypothetical protein